MAMGVWYRKSAELLYYALDVRVMLTHCNEYSYVHTHAYIYIYIYICIYNFRRVQPRLLVYCRFLLSNWHMFRSGRLSFLIFKQLNCYMMLWMYEPCLHSVMNKYVYTYTYNIYNCRRVQPRLLVYHGFLQSNLQMFKSVVCLSFIKNFYPRNIIPEVLMK